MYTNQKDDFVPINCGGAPFSKAIRTSFWDRAPEMGPFNFAHRVDQLTGVQTRGSCSIDREKTITMVGDTGRLVKGLTATPRTVVSCSQPFCLASPQSANALLSPQVSATRSLANSTITQLGRVKGSRDRLSPCFGFPGPSRAADPSN